MKKNKGAMIALGEESDGDESDDSSNDGRAFVPNASSLMKPESLMLTTEKTTMMRSWK